MKLWVSVHVAGATYPSGSPARLCRPPFCLLVAYFIVGTPLLHSFLRPTYEQPAQNLRRTYASSIYTGLLIILYWLSYCLSEDGQLLSATKGTTKVWETLVSEVENRTFRPQGGMLQYNSLFLPLRTHAGWMQPFRQSCLLFNPTHVSYLLYSSTHGLSDMCDASFIIAE